MGTIMHVRHIATTLAVPLLLCAQAVCTQLDKEQSLRSRTVDKQVAALIEKMLSKTTERQAFVELEALGCPALPAIIQRMDDRRSLPKPYITLRNKSPQAFEEIRCYRFRRRCQRAGSRSTRALKGFGCEVFCQGYRGGASSLYPAVIVAIVLLKERLTSWKAMGVCATLSAIPLIVDVC